MLKKIALHWQILIALVIAVVYGLVYPTEYNITKGSLSELSNKKVSVEVLAAVENLLNEGRVNFTTQKAFMLALEKHLSPEMIKKNKSVIMSATYDNPFVSSVAWMGDIFLRALKMLIIPLILSSLITGVTNIQSSSGLGRLSLKTMGYYVMTSIMAIVTGLLLVNIIQPGVGADLSFSETVEGLVDKQRSFTEILVEIVPSNIFEALSTGDMLSIIFFAILLGFFITMLTEKPKTVLKDFFNSIFDVMMKITLFVIKFTPLGIFGIVAKVVADQDDLGNLVSRMSLYMGTVILALGIHYFITLPLITKFIGKASPFKHMKNMSTALMTAFSTSSSGATLPLTINCVEEKSGVSHKISSFTLPLGATINMDGTALYECVAAMFIAQAYGVHLGPVEQIIVVATALLASIGAAAIPMAGLVMITVILTAVNLPLEGVGLILAVDRILDMFRTSTNVWSDSCGAVVIAKSEGEELNV